MIEVSGVTKRFGGLGGGFLAVADMNLTVPQGQWCTILGPSGCGKSTTLRMLAGLESPTTGRIDIADRTVFDADRGVAVPANRRNIGMVFQSYALWPHMSLEDNVAFPLRFVKPRAAKTQRRHRANEVLETMGLGGLGKRPISALSGGQQQRAALARALVAEPSILLLDEPLSNLDLSLRQQMCQELRRVQQELGVTTVFVTHDQAEALTMSDRIVLMAGGHVVQDGSPTELFQLPDTSFAAAFMGFSNNLAGNLVGPSQCREFVDVDTPIGRVQARRARGVNPGDRCEVRIRPSGLTIGPSATAPAFCAAVTSLTFQGDVSEVRMDFNGHEFRAVVAVRNTANLHVGDEVKFGIVPTEAIVVAPDDTADAELVADQRMAEEKL